MMRPFILAAAAAAAAVLGCASVGQAQVVGDPVTGTGTRIPTKPSALEGEQLGRVTKSFARCVFQRRPDQAHSLLASSDLAGVVVPASLAKDMNRKLDMTNCLMAEVAADQNAATLVFNAPLLRDILAEEAYLSRNPSSPPALIAATPGRFVSVGPRLQIARDLTDLADCTIDADLAGADRLLRTMPRGLDEAQAAAKLAPSIGGCLYEGQSMELAPAAIRRLIAFGLYSRFGRK